jgi:hypothetical protein
VFLTCFWVLLPKELQGVGWAKNSGKVVVLRVAAGQKFLHLHGNSCTVRQTALTSRPPVAVGRAAHPAVAPTRRHC